MSDPQPSSLPIAGIELGGTKCVCTPGWSPDRVIEQERLPTATPGETIDALRTVLARWIDQHGIAALGIGAFGPIRLDPATPDFGHVLETSKAGWSGADLIGPLTRDVDVPVAFDTDGATDAIRKPACIAIRRASGTIPPC